MPIFSEKICPMLSKNIETGLQTLPITERISRLNIIILANKR
jgi:hypothetical protein